MTTNVYELEEEVGGGAECECVREKQSKQAFRFRSCIVKFFISNVEGEGKSKKGKARSKS